MNIPNSSSCSSTVQSNIKMKQYAITNLFFRLKLCHFQLGDKNVLLCYNYDNRIQGPLTWKNTETNKGTVIWNWWLKISKKQRKTRRLTELILFNTVRRLNKQDHSYTKRRFKSKSVNFQWYFCDVFFLSILTGLKFEMEQHMCALYCECLYMCIL